MKSKISIVIPVYNVEQYLKRCIDSILNQTFADFEILLVNDGSTDNSGKICDEYSKKDSRVKVINQQNSGAPTARNAAMDAAEGEYIYFVDSDDYIHPQTLEILYDVITKNDADVSVCGYERVYEQDVEFKKITNYKSSIISNFDLLEKMVNLLSQYEMTYSHVLWNKLFKRQAIGETRMNTEYVIDDFDFVSRVLFKCTTVAVVDKKLYFYYLNTTGVMRNTKYNPKKILALQAWYDMAITHKQLGNDKMYNKCMERSFSTLLNSIMLCWNGTVKDLKWIEYLKQQINLKRNQYMEQSNFFSNCMITCFEKNYKSLEVIYRLLVPLWKMARKFMRKCKYLINKAEI